MRLIDGTRERFLRLKLLHKRDLKLEGMLLKKKKLAAVDQTVYEKSIYVEVDGHVKTHAEIVRTGVAKKSKSSVPGEQVDSSIATHTLITTESL